MTDQNPLTNPACECGGMTRTESHSPLCPNYELIVANARSDFDFVGDFQKKFGRPSVSHDGVCPHQPEDKVAYFQSRLMLEELGEFFQAVGLEKLAEYMSALAEETREDYDQRAPGESLSLSRVQMSRVADALVDLSYTILSTAHEYGLPWAELFAEVHRSNMSKVRAGVDHAYVRDPPCCQIPAWLHSKRGSDIDVVKPPNWQAPRIEELLAEVIGPGASE